MPKHQHADYSELTRRGDLALAEYGIVGDGRTAALIARDGAVDWLCYGRFDGAAVFCRLLDADRGGYFQIAPSGRFGASRRYLPRTNVLETEFECSSGKVRLTDSMPLDLARGTTLLRKLEALSGDVELRVHFAPTFDFARADTKVEISAEGCRASGASQTLLLWCPAPMRTGTGAASAALRLRAGEKRWLMLTDGQRQLDEAAAEGALQATVRDWERWSALGRYVGPYEHELRRSALVLKLLVHTPSGAMVASPTTSLPEDIGGVRNWDYRFTWLRDASWLVSALMDLGYHDESMAFLGWLQQLDLGGDTPSVVYDFDGKAPSNEQALRHLRGYRDSRPVRIGNAAASQDQHDVLGEVVSAIHMCSDAMPSMRPLEPRLWKLVSALADKAAVHWKHADYGMWEVRDRPRHFVSSKLLCWTALDRAVAIARRDGLDGPVALWQAEAAQVRRAILTSGFDGRLGAFRRAFGESELDATSLLFPLHGIVPANEPRFVRTVEVVRQGLSSAGLLRRYLGSDGLSGGEGAFAACSFWLSDCLARQGRIDDARAVFEHVFACANDLGLLSEEISPESGELLGNFPQAFTHLALIRAAVSIAKAANGGV